MLRQRQEYEMLDSCRVIVCDAGPTFKHHWVNFSCLLVIYCKTIHCFVPLVCHCKPIDDIHGSCLIISRENAHTVFVHFLFTGENIHA